MTDTEPTKEATDHFSRRLADAGYTARDILFASEVQNSLHAPPDAILKMHTMHILSSAQMLREVINQGRPIDADLIATLAGIVPLLRESADLFDGMVQEGTN